MLRLWLPLLFATFAVLQDAHILVDYDGCTKDNQLLAILIFLVVCSISRRFAVRGFWLMLLAMQVAFYVGNAYISDFLPDTWSATEHVMFAGFPVIQGAAVVLVVSLSLLAYMRGQIHRREALKCVLGITLITVSAQLWLYGNHNIEAKPWRAWTTYEKTDRIVMVNEEGRFIGQPWVVGNTDYQRTMCELKTFWASAEYEHYYVAPRQGHRHPDLYRLSRVDGVIFLESQDWDMEWGADMVWVWEYVLSFILVFAETFMVTQTILGLWRERKSSTMNTNSRIL